LPRAWALASFEPAPGYVAALAYLGLLCTWLMVAVRTAHGSVRGNLLTAQPSTAPVRAHKDAAR
jgi:hypothetical protein